MDHPEIPVDNNYSEQQIKSYATGRKAWLFAYDAAGAQASANLFSLVMTCRANEIEPYAYLNYLFEQLPAATTVGQVEALLPWNVKALLDEQKRRIRQPPDAATSYPLGDLARDNASAAGPRRVKLRRSAEPVRC